MAMLDWSQCPAVESIPDKVGGAWVFRGTRLPVPASERQSWPRLVREPEQLCGGVTPYPQGPGQNGCV